MELANWPVVSLSGEHVFLNARILMAVMSLDLQMAARPALCARGPGGAGYGLFPCRRVDTAGDRRLRISGTYDPEALARLIRGLSG